MSDFAGYKKTIMNAAHNDRIRLALSRAIGSYRSNRNTALTKFPHTIKMAEEVREMRSHAIGNMQAMAEEAVAAIESNKGHGYIAKTAEEALKIIGDLVGTGKLIVKGKSMTGEEVGLREHLEEAGNEVYETDLGEFIIQQLNSKPMHILSPAIHVPKEDVAELFSKIVNEKLPAEDIERLINDHPNVSPETREQVLRVVTETDRNMLPGRSSFSISRPRGPIPPRTASSRSPVFA